MLVLFFLYLVISSIFIYSYLSHASFYVILSIRQVHVSMVNPDGIILGSGASNIGFLGYRAVYKVSCFLFFIFYFYRIIVLVPLDVW